MALTPQRLFGMRVEEPGPLRPSEDTAVLAGQGDPFGLTACPAEAFQCVFTSGKILHILPSAGLASLILSNA